MLTMTKIPSSDSSIRTSDSPSSPTINTASTSSAKDVAVPFGQLVKAPKPSEPSTLDESLIAASAQGAEPNALLSTFTTPNTEPAVPQGFAVIADQTLAASRQQAFELLNPFTVTANARQLTSHADSHAAHPSLALTKESTSSSSINLASQVTPSGQDKVTSRPIGSELANLLTSLSSQTVPAQQTPGHQASPAPTITTPSTTEWAPVRVDTQAGKWGEQMLQVLNDRVTLQAQQNLQEARIRLDPPDLGKLDLLVRVEGDRLSVQINANAAATREALMQVSERLRFELQNQNFMHVDVQVGTGEGQHQSPQHNQEEESTVLASQRFDDDSSFQTTLTTAEHWLSTQA